MDMDVAKAFTFVAEDEEWLSKMGIGALVSLASFLILPIFLLLGYVVQVTRNVKDGDPRPLPQWTNWERLFMDGLYVAIAQIVYTLPFWILLCVATVATVGFGGLAESSEDAAAVAIITTWGVAGCLLMLFAIALLFISPAIIIQYVRTGELSATLRFGEVLGIARENAGPILIAALAMFVVSTVFSFVVGGLQLIPCIGWIIGAVIGIFAGPWFAAASGHLYGQIAANVDFKTPPKPAF
jgi:hypothetical protein